MCCCYILSVLFNSANIIAIFAACHLAVPSAPEGPLVISDVTHKSVVISWRPPKSTGGLELTAYIIERRDVKKTSWVKVDKIKPKIRTYCVQKLAEGNEYYFRVFAENKKGLSEPLQSAEAVLICRDAGVCLLFAFYLFVWFKHSIFNKVTALNLSLSSHYKKYYYIVLYKVHFLIH